MKKLLTILLILVCVSGYAGKLNEGRDPTAARDDLSNVTPAVGLAALGGAKLAGNNVFTGPASFTNFVQLGELALPSKYADLQGTTTVGVGTTVMSHGVLTIEGAEVFVYASGAALLVPPGFPSAALNFYWYIEAGDLKVAVNADSTSVFGCTIHARVRYRENL